MRPCSPLAPLLWALSLLTLAPVHADTPARLPQLNVIALGQGQVMEAAPPRQLSLNAHVSEFAYQPGGLEIAYAGSETEGGTTTQFVKLVGTRQGTTTTLLAQTDWPPGSGDAVAPFYIIGWSADARFLVATQYRTLETIGAGEHVGGMQIICVDMGASPPQVRLIAPFVPMTPDAAFSETHPRWSPRHTRLLLQQVVALYSPKPSAQATALYDFARDRVDVLPIDAPTYAVGWADDTRLRLAGTDDLRAHPLVFNVKTLKTEPFVPAPTSPSRNFSLSPTNPNITLDLQPQTLADALHTAQTHANVLWVRRMRGPKALSTLALDVTGGRDDPQPQWAQTGREVAYLSHGDLFIADLSTRDATIKEKYLAGDKLTCPEERQLALGEVKQIGLAAMQYSQDYDEHYPPQASFDDTIAPYLPPDALLQIGSAKFAYHAPADLSLAAMDNPAMTILGTMDLPCAQIVLYADGHVKTLPKGTP